MQEVRRGRQLIGFRGGHCCAGRSPFSGLTTRYARWSNAVGGVALLVIGVLLLFRPEWLAFG